MRNPTTLVLALFCAVLASAADISLTDGRTFINASVISQSPGRVCIKHTGGLVQVEKTMLTGSLSAQYPANSAAAQDEDAKWQAAAELLAAEQKEQAAAFRSASARSTRRSQESRPDDSLVAVKDVARNYAKRFFEKQSAGNTSSWSFSSGCTVEEPEPISGWSNQWRVSGEASTRSMSSQGGLSSPSRRFEAVVEKKGSDFVVIDFTVRS